jgi:glycine/D-amino acid oxidase-like deaminating enzyme
VDVTVRGAGIFGLSVAYACLRRGARVRVIDPAGPGAGASGGVVGALAPHVPENWNPKKAFQLEALLMAADFWAGAEAASGRASGYGRTGRLQPLADAAAVELARAREEGARELWQGMATWQVIAAPEDGWSPPSPTGLLIRDTLTARLHPARAVACLADAVRALGGEIAAEGPEAGATVWATGAAGLAALSRAFDRPVGTGVKGQAALLRHDAGAAAPQLFAEGLHIVPHDDGTVAVGSTSERDFDDPSATDAQLDAVIARARELCPVLAEAPVVARWAGVRPRARTRAPLLGAWPGRAGHFVANGGFKIGFGIAPKVGAALADLVLEGRDAIPDAFTLAHALGR